jgi:hypothetical protein
MSADLMPFTYEGATVRTVLIDGAAFTFVFAFAWWWGKRQSVSLGAVPPAAEGGRPGEGVQR